MNKDQDERLVTAYEGIAAALKGLHDEAQRAGARFWPDRPEQKESILTRVENEEDRAKKSLGVDGSSIEQWLTDLDAPGGDDRVIGDRSREWVRNNTPKEENSEVADAGSQTASDGEESGDGSKETQG